MFLTGGRKWWRTDAWKDSPLVTRIYITPIVGNGTTTGDVDNPYRSLLTDHMTVEGDRVCSNIASIDIGPQRGRPLRPWTLCFARLADWGPVDADPRAILIADLDVPDALTFSLPSGIKNALVATAGLAPQEGNSLDKVETAVRVLFAKHYTHVSADGFLLSALGVPDVKGGMAHGTGFVVDHFTDTDNVLLQDHTPDTGGAWEALDFYFVDSSSIDAHIKTNRCRSVNWTVDSRTYRNAADPGGNEYDVSVDFIMGQADSTQAHFSLMARLSPTGVINSAVDRYEARYHFHPTASSRVWLMHKVVANLHTELDTAVSDVGTGTRTLKLEIRDATKKMFSDSVEKLTTFDNAVTQDGRAGIALPSRENFTNYAEDFLAEVHVAPIIVPILGAPAAHGTNVIMGPGRMIAG